MDLVESPSNPSSIVVSMESDPTITETSLPKQKAAATAQDVHTLKETKTSKSSLNAPVESSNSAEVKKPGTDPKIVNANVPKKGSQPKQAAPIRKPNIDSKTATADKPPALAKKTTARKSSIQPQKVTRAAATPQVTAKKAATIKEPPPEPKLSSTDGTVVPVKKAKSPRSLSNAPKQATGTAKAASEISQAKNTTTKKEIAPESNKVASKAPAQRKKSGDTTPASATVSAQQSQVGAAKDMPTTQVKALNDIEPPKILQTRRTAAANKPSIQREPANANKTSALLKNGAPAEPSIKAASGPKKTAGVKQPPAPAKQSVTFREGSPDAPPKKAALSTKAQASTRPGPKAPARGIVKKQSASRYDQTVRARKLELAASKSRIAILSADEPEDQLMEDVDSDSQTDEDVDMEDSDASPTPARKLRKPPGAPAPEIIYNEALNNIGIEYEVEAIADSKMERRTRYYFVKWVGWPESENTWEPEANLRNAKAVLAEFREMAKDKAAQVQV